MSDKLTVEAVFTRPLAEAIWTANATHVFPVTLNNFSVGSVLPAVLYMFRRGCRRGRGTFRDAFSPPGTLVHPSIYMVAARLTMTTEDFHGFTSDLSKDILGDLLLGEALETLGHTDRHDVEVQRAYPVHYFSSWLDLPASVAHLRFVPEMLVALLANQQTGDAVSTAADGEFPVGRSPEANLLFRVFAQGVEFGPHPGDLAADVARESHTYSVEELLMVRLAQACGHAPERMRGLDKIPNMLPIARRATEVFREDLSCFLRHFGTAIPRRALTPMLESTIGLGLWHSFLASLGVAESWDKDGRLPSYEAQVPTGVFVDASNGIDVQLRDLSERSLDGIVRVIDGAIATLASVRIIDAKARVDLSLRNTYALCPDMSGWMSLLGDIRFGRHPRSNAILNDLREKVVTLSDQLPDHADAQDVLASGAAEHDPVRVLAEAVTLLMGEKLHRASYLKFIDSCTLANAPHGMVRKRRVSRRTSSGARKLVDARSFVLPNTLLEALVHTHLAMRGGKLALREFVDLLRERYGLWIDDLPPGLEASREDLLRNRAVLEQRLRDLGLLHGVNDAEAMKHLHRRYCLDLRT